MQGGGFLFIESAPLCLFLAECEANGPFTGEAKHEQTAAYRKYDHPAGGWGSVKAVTSALVNEHVALNGARILLHQNKPDGFACVSCSWAKPADPHLFEFCENGARATAWELTKKRIDQDFLRITRSRD